MSHNAAKQSPKAIAADTITDEQIQELLDLSLSAEGDLAVELCAAAGVEYLDAIDHLCTVALNPRCGKHRVHARACCAEILNVRMAGAK